MVLGNNFHNFLLVKLLLKYTENISIRAWRPTRKSSVTWQDAFTNYLEICASHMCFSLTLLTNFMT